MLVAGPDRTGGATVGMDCLISVRPESIQVAPADSAERLADGNQLKAYIRTLLFMGQNYEADIELPGGQMVLINLPPTTSWQEGQEVTLSVLAERLQLWDASAVTESEE